MIDKEMLDDMCCPDCHGVLELNEGAAHLLCLQCGKRYPIRDGIPVMIIDEAEPPAPGFVPQSPAPAS